MTIGNILSGRKNEETTQPQLWSMGMVWNCEYAVVLEVAEA